MLKYFMEYKGRFPRKMIKKGQFGAEHFDAEGRFVHRTVDRVTQREKLVIGWVEESRDISREFGIHSGRGDDRKGTQLKDILDKILMLDPAKRISIGAASNHAFITEKC